MMSTSARHALRGFVHCVAGLIVVAGVIAAAPGCSNPFGGRVCTEIGCSDGIRVTFEAPPPDGTLVELGGSFGVPWRVECGVDLDCSTGIFFADFTPDHLSVRVITSGGEVTESFQLTYQELRPNGGDCPPTCRIATVLMGLPD
jgi:hypothetical protein